MRAGLTIVLATLGDSRQFGVRLSRGSVKPTGFVRRLAPYDNPHTHNRHDAEATKMSKPVNPLAVLDAIKHTNAEIITSFPENDELAA